VNIVLSPVAYFPQTGGVPTSVRRLARGLQERGHRVVVVTPWLESTQSDRDRIDGVDVHRLPFAFPFRMLWQTPREGLGPLCRYGLRDLRRLLRILADERAEVVDVQSLTGPNLPYLLLASRFRGCRFVGSLHGNEFAGMTRRADRMRRLLLRSALRTSACVTAVSHRVAAEATRFCPEVAGRIVRIPTAVRVDEYQRAVPFVSRAPYILTLARLNGLKGHDVLLSAFQQVVESDPEIRLVIAGSGSQRARLHAVTLALGLANRVTFLGEVDRGRVPALLAGCRFLVLASWSEGIPNVILEAMAAGKAVVATAVGGTPEVVADPERGRLVPPGDPTQLAQAMLDLLRDPARCSAMGEAGRAYVRRDHDVDRVVDQYEAVYRAAVEQRT
jgi:glycosyltransferase involved in cell wall biosynthesis